MTHENLKIWRKKNDLNALKMGLRRNQAWQQVLGEPIPTEEIEKKASH